MLPGLLAGTTAFRLTPTKQSLTQKCTNLRLTLASDLWLLAILVGDVTAFSKSFPVSSQLSAQRRTWTFLNVGVEGEGGERGILHDLTASSTSAALSAGLFAHIKQVWASLPCAGQDCVWGRQLRADRRRSLANGHEAKTIGGTARGNACMGPSRWTLGRLRELLRGAGDKGSMSARIKQVVFCSQLRSPPCVFCYREFPVKVGHGSSMAARVNTHTHTHTRARHTCTCTHTGEIGSGRFVGCQSATSTCKSTPYMRVQMKFKV